MMTYSFTLTEYEPGKPWMIRATGRQSVELEDGRDFHAWAREQWPADRYRVVLDRPPLMTRSDRRR
jgi:hypothetical protein